jgi:hypothetical protein
MNNSNNAMQFKDRLYNKHHYFCVFDSTGKYHDNIKSAFIINTVLTEDNFTEINNEGFFTLTNPRTNTFEFFKVVLDGLYKLTMDTKLYCISCRRYQNGELVAVIREYV